jgi:hypothetical protein
MGLVDVSELMDDDEFASVFMIRRPTVTVSVEGDASTSYSTIRALGPVQPAKPADAQYLPAGTKIDDVINVWSKTEMRAGDGKSTTPDVLEVAGVRYRVIKLEDRGQNGFWQAWAERIVTS